MADSIIIEREVKKNPFWVDYILGRIKKKKNFLLIISGPTGSGKSWASLSIAEMLDPNFGPDRIIFGFRNLMKLINSGEQFKPGSVFCWDEFQIDAGNRNWQSLTNKLLNSLLSTFRHRNFILIINAPFQDFIDSSSRKLLHAEFSCQSIDYEKNTCKVKPQLIQYNSRNKKFYYKYLRVRTLNRGVSPINAWNIPMPSKSLIEEYERMKNRFTSKLNADIERQLDQIEKKNVVEKKELTELQKTAMELLARKRSMDEIAIEMKISKRVVYEHIKAAKKKGWLPNDFAETPIESLKNRENQQNDAS